MSISLISTFMWFVNGIILFTYLHYTESETVGSQKSLLVLGVGRNFREYM